MATKFEKVKYENDVMMIFCGTFFGEPVYSRVEMVLQMPEQIINPQKTMEITCDQNK